MMKRVATVMICPAPLEDLPFFCSSVVDGDWDGSRDSHGVLGSRTLTSRRGLCLDGPLSRQS